MLLTTEQIDGIMSKLEKGESLNSLLELYPEHKKEIQEIHEMLDFMKAQTLAIKPSKAGLQAALDQMVSWDDEEAGSGWHQWFKNWQWMMGGSLSLALLLLVFTPWAEGPETTVLLLSDSAAPMVATSQSILPEMESLRVMAGDEMVQPTSDMDQLLSELESDFEDELVEYQNLKEDLMPLAEDEIFSARLNNSLLVF